jgi:hypothetical protein
MGVPYASAKSGLAAREEITKLLSRFGCSSVGFMDDFAEHSVLLAFSHRGRAVQLRASAKGWAQMFLKENPLLIPPKAVEAKLRARSNRTRAYCDQLHTSRLGEGSAYSRGMRNPFIRSGVYALHAHQRRTPANRARLERKTPSSTRGRTPMTTKAKDGRETLQERLRARINKHIDPRGNVCVGQYNHWDSALDLDAIRDLDAAQAEIARLTKDLQRAEARDSGGHAPDGVTWKHAWMREAEWRGRAVDAANMLIDLCAHADFRNGNTDQSQSCDEGERLAAGIIEQAKALLPEQAPPPPTGSRGGRAADAER